MEFKDFFSTLKNRISDGCDVPQFFHDLFAMITDIPEEEWGAPQDPATKKTKDASLRSYAKRTIPKKFAQQIVYRLSTENYIESLNSRPIETRSLLADDFSACDAEINGENVAEKNGKMVRGNYPQCYATYSLDDSKKIRKELQGIKKVLEGHSHGVTLLDDLPLERGIIGVIGKIKKLKEKDLAEASLEPKEIRQKLNPSDNFVLYSQVNYFVMTYFVRIREIMINLDKRGEIDYDTKD